MPSWNIHTAHVDRLLAERPAAELGIADSNAFLFGNYVPDIYVGFMVPDTTFRIDYCLTHCAIPSTTPVPDADRFWDECVCHPFRKPQTQNALSLTLGAWAHLVADRTYNQRFRTFCATHDTPEGDRLRKQKQADFDLFGRSLEISSRVHVTPDLIDAANRFRPYSILAADVKRAAEVANKIMRNRNVQPDRNRYQLLDRTWMAETFDACHEHIIAWLAAWQRLQAEGAAGTSNEIREQL